MKVTTKSAISKMITCSAYCRGTIILLRTLGLEKRRRPMLLLLSLSLWLLSLLFVALVTI